MVGVVHVRNVRMSMPHRPMLVRVRMWLARRIGLAVCVSVMFIMDMRMRVRHRFVFVLMNMLFRQKKPHANRHQGTSTDQLKRNGLAQKTDTMNYTALVNSPRFLADPTRIK